MSRSLSPAFMEDLQTGKLQNLLDYVRYDDTLMLAIRKKSINIYYRGGSLFKITEISPHNYRAHFDEKYIESKNPANTLMRILGVDPVEYLKGFPKQVSSSEAVDELIRDIPILKHIMDRWFSGNQWMEKETQQLIVRENNHSPISNESEYFIIDIELAESELGARFDMVAIKWPATSRKKDKVTLALIELEYGDSALNGQSGIKAHLKDMQSYINNSDKLESLCRQVETQATQLNDLGLLRHTKVAGRKFVVESNAVEVIFMFANHNPRASVLVKALKELTSEQKSITPRFFIASTAGYAMHAACMVDADEYSDFIDKQNKKAERVSFS